ncbi:MAG: alpha-amylase family glycosyl hydrolase, partial [Spirochaetaceae bacterium]|nr:alpha-amylase family glycosyl hydrolase [Spirochaetaceae bacterium]
RPQNMITVAEAPGVVLPDMPKYIGEKEGVFSMIFTFDHMDLDIRFDSPCRVFPWKRSDWKDRMTSWQRATADDGWMGLFLENHDQVRSVSRFGDSGEYRIASAKTLATWFFLMRGTPFIYQGQELGMTNCPFASISEYRDLASLNLHREAMAAEMSEAEILSYLAARSRDHARTPMPWDSGPLAGFTEGESWIRLHPEHRTVNVEAQLRAGDSVLEHYRRLIELRRGMAVFADGDFEELEASSDRFGGYRRRLGDTIATVWCNFSTGSLALPEAKMGEALLDPSGAFDGLTLAPWQSVVLLRKGIA